MNVGVFIWLCISVAFAGVMADQLAGEWHTRPDGAHGLFDFALSCIGFVLVAGFVIALAYFLFV